MKRHLLRTFLCLIAFGVVTVRAAGKPNLVIINIDDLGYADIGPYGSKLNRTPNLDRMAAEGRKLTCFYAAPVCSPSRAALMTGCYPKRVLPIGGVLFPGAAVGLNPAERTVAEVLKSAGYATACIGKWHLGDQPEFLPTQQGFDYFLGLPYSHDMGPPEDGIKSSLGERLRKSKAEAATDDDLAEVGIRGTMPQPPLPLVENGKIIARMRPDELQGMVKRYTEAAVEFIRANQDKPFFLYLPHNAVHGPLYPGPSFHKKSANGLQGDWIEEVDWSVGQVLDTLRELKLDAATCVLFTSDNGGTARSVNAPLRGLKGSTWEGGMREPTIAWWPGKIPAGTTTAEITGMIDILPTFAKLAGADVPSDRKIDGSDIWPLLAGATGAKSPHEVFYYFRGLILEGIRSGPWKLHLKKNELYNLDDDIGESTNVAAANPLVVKRLQELVLPMDADLGRTKALGPGCRPLGRVENPQPLLSREGKVRAGFEVN